ncbi:MAG: peptidoglycan-binding domain-containing protein [Acidimicrobiales bacterium]
MHRGDTGQSVRELHNRLQRLGYAAPFDDDEVFGDATAAMVEAFQRARGLPITGEVDDTTWSRLVEAGWHLGDRLLYLTRPFQRGDDVAELQIRLAQLGFDPGRIDGIFGTLLDGALIDFQRNRALEPTGVLTRATLLELWRMTSIMADRNLVTEARDRAGFNELPSDLVVVAGSTSLADAVARDWTLGNLVRLESSNPDEIAATANGANAAIVLSFQFNVEIQGIHIHYWASYRSHSRRGEQLASALAAALASKDLLPRVEVTGMALPVLRETRMTTLQVEHGAYDDQVDEIATIMNALVRKVLHNEPATSV